MTYFKSYDIIYVVLCPMQHAATASPLQRAGGLPDLDRAKR